MLNLKNNFKKGFTILELMVVLSIIAVLFAVVFVDVVKYINKSKDAAIKIDMQYLASSSGNYYSQTGSFNSLCKQNDFTKGMEGMIKNGSSKISCWDNSGLTEKIPEVEVRPMAAGAPLGEDFCAKDQWVMVSELVSEEGQWCIDSIGKKVKMEEGDPLDECQCPEN